jgi:hypothetical protein
MAIDTKQSVSITKRNKAEFYQKVRGTFSVAASVALLASACGPKNVASTAASTEDSSVSGSVGETVGGAFNGSANGQQAFQEIPVTRWYWSFLFGSDVLASTMGVCPTVSSATTGCTVSTSGGAPLATLTYSNCSFSGSQAVWNGSLDLLFPAGTSVSCGGSFPASITGNVVRSFGTGTVRTSASGVAVTVDTVGTQNAIDGHLYSGGAVVHFSGGTRDSLTLEGVNLIASGKFNHTLTTAPVGSSSTPLVISGGSVINSGSVTTFHNLAKVVATTTFNNVGFSTGCCTPTSGTLSTTFATEVGTTPSALGAKLVGTTETLSFTGCGTGTYSGIDGTPGPVTLGHCF